MAKVLHKNDIDRMGGEAEKSVEQISSENRGKNRVSPITSPSQIPRAQRIVVKVGSSSLTSAAGGELDVARLTALVNAISARRSEGTEVVLVSSGAIAAGYKTTAFLLDDDVLIDAGTGVGDLSLEEMLRIDHVLGLFRLWWIPEGHEAADGAYVSYDHEAMIGILALEAQRSGTLVVGEDLGTFEPWVRDYLVDRGIMGTSILWFEYDGEGKPLRAEDYRTAHRAVAALADHRPGLVADVDAAWGTPELEDASELRDHLVARGVPRATLEIVVDRAQDQAD